MARRRRLRVEIRGAVQGVGFRPFVYRLATELELTGWVLNDTRGVFIEVEGPEHRLQKFLRRLYQEKPPLAFIQGIEVHWDTAKGYDTFQIRHSAEEGTKIVLVLPDMATCPQCLKEVLDPEDRRYRYPFTNCTNCGPRFSIIEALPYDRPHTTMRHFPMCDRCRAEYEDPLDRRFHAQPNACPECGPTLACYTTPEVTRNLNPLDRRGPISLDGNSSRFPTRYRDYMLVSTGNDAVIWAADALRKGYIVAVKGLGGFHLMVDARNEEAIARLRERKPRRDKPFAVMVRDLQQARALCLLSPVAEALLISPQAPIVLLPRKADAPVAMNVAPDNPYLGIMLPYTPLHHLLLRAVDFPLVATSGNLTDEPICTDEWEAMERLAPIAEIFLIHDRPIARHVDDSVTYIVRDRPRLLRRARGYAPLPVFLQEDVPIILAVGGHLKNTVALSVGRQVFISQHIGDLDTVEARDAFERVIADFLRLYEAQPIAVAHDMHPDYASTQWVEQITRQVAAHTLTYPPGTSLPPEPEGPDISNSPDTGATTVPIPLAAVRYIVPVQHHHAHFAACLAEQGIAGPALGVTWDGTGYGPDGTIWGGEFLAGDMLQVERVATLRPFRLPGGDAAVKAPKRVAFALLWELYEDQVTRWTDLPPFQALNEGEQRLLSQMLHRHVNAPLTTSMGRLFDAVAALLGLHQEVTFEGQAAMALEYLVKSKVQGGYPLTLVQNIDPRPADGHPPRCGYWDWQATVEGILEDLRKGVDRAKIAARFHRTLVDWIVQVARMVDLPRVALTGGVFQNRVLTEWASEHLQEAGFEVLLHEHVPPNDGGISLGQIAIAAARLRAVHREAG